MLIQPEKMEGVSLKGEMGSNEGITTSRQKESPDLIIHNGKEQFFNMRKFHSSNSANTSKIKCYTLTAESIIKALVEQAKEETSAIDKFMNITLKNFFGEFRNISLSHYDTEINGVLDYWMSWQSVYPCTRQTPLLYKCYICKKGWWRLHPFKEHLRTHTNPYVQLRTESYEDELCIYASLCRMSRPEPVEVDSPCWKCKRGVLDHKITKQSQNYECDDCGAISTICNGYNHQKAMCKMFRQSSDVQSQCKICGLLFTGADLYYNHLSDYHTVRSDEPIAIVATECEDCKGRYAIRKFHDCPERHKSFKCTHCSRKFTEVALKNVHLQLSKKKVVCSECGKSMAGCGLSEHYLKHTKNYAAAYFCWECDNRVLFTKLQYYRNHMKHHVTHLAQNKWGSLMMLPKKCVDGEIFHSETSLTISHKKLAAFMDGLENLKKGKANKRKIVREEKRNSVANNVALPEKPKSPENMINLHPNEPLTEEQLEAEIMKAMEIEAVVSEVFKTSTSYRKMIEKEKMEEQSTRKSTETENIKMDITETENKNERVIEIDDDDDLSEKDLVIVEMEGQCDPQNNSGFEEFEGNVQCSRNNDEVIMDEEEEDLLVSKEEQDTNCESIDESASDFEDDLEWIVSCVAKEKDVTVENNQGFSRRDVEAGGSTKVTNDNQMLD